MIQPHERTSKQPVYKQHQHSPSPERVLLGKVSRQLSARIHWRSACSHPQAFLVQPHTSYRQAKDALSVQEVHHLSSKALPIVKCSSQSSLKTFKCIATRKTLESFPSHDRSSSLSQLLLSDPARSPLPSFLNATVVDGEGNDGFAVAEVSWEGPEREPGLFAISCGGCTDALGHAVLPL